MMQGKAPKGASIPKTGGGSINLPVMTPSIAAILVNAALLALIYWAAFCHAEASPRKSGIKTGSVLMLAVAGWTLGGPSLLILALCACALGDYLLSLDLESSFLAGVGAFAIGHVIYVLLFLSLADSDVWNLLGGTAIIGATGLFLLGVAMAAILWRSAGQLRWAVLAYIPVITSMGLASLTLPLGQGYAILHGAAFLFILSDAILALQIFVLKPPDAGARVAPFLVWPTYWGAQMLFTVGFVVATPN